MAANEKLAPHRLRLELASDFRDLEGAVEKTQRFMEKMTSDEDLAYRVVLLTSEAVTNAMEHGNGLDPRKKVFVDITVYSERIEVCVEDEGVGFNRDDVAHPLHQGDLLDDSGRGLFLMDQLADEVRWERDGCLLRMAFHRAS